MKLAYQQPLVIEHGGLRSLTGSAFKYLKEKLEGDKNPIKDKLEGEAKAIKDKLEGELP